MNQIPNQARPENGILFVGPCQQYRSMQAAHEAAIPGDTIMIDADGVYFGFDAVMSFKKANLTIKGFNGRPKIELPYEAPGEVWNAPSSVHLQTRAMLAANGGAIWRIQAPGIVVENFEIAGAINDTGNGAALAANDFIGTVTYRDLYIHHAEIPLQVFRHWGIDVIMERVEVHNGGMRGDVRGSFHGHNIYIEAKSLEFRHSYTHSKKVTDHGICGHLLKTRTENAIVKYNRFADDTPEATHGSSRLLEFAESGNAYIIGNVFYSKAGNGNYAIDIGAENISAFNGARNRGRKIYIVNNTFISDNRDSTSVRIFGPVPADINHAEDLELFIVNNIFPGSQEDIDISFPEGRISRVVIENNFFTGLPDETPDIFVDRTRGCDANIADTAAAREFIINQGVDANALALRHGFAPTIDLTPGHMYASPGVLKPRTIIDGSIDIGAYEFKCLT